MRETFSGVGGTRALAFEGENASDAGLMGQESYGLEEEFDHECHVILVDS